MKKHTVIKLLFSLDEEFDTEELIEQLLFIDKVEKGLQNIEDGKVIDYEKVKKDFFSKRD